MLMTCSIIYYPTLIYAIVEKRYEGSEDREAAVRQDQGERQPLLSGTQANAG